MLFHIDHHTCYRYSVPIQPHRHLLRVRPMLRAGQHTESCDIQFEPVPTQHTLRQDRWGNPLDQVDFAGSTQTLDFRVLLTVRTDALGLWPSPMDFALSTIGSASAPMPYEYVAPLDDSPALYDFTARLWCTVGDSGLAFLDALTSTLHTFHHPGARADGAPLRPTTTLLTATGVCRDLTLLFMTVCRRVGIPSRFVSGYLQNQSSQRSSFLHAWAEAHIPDFGWLGFDPSQGQRVSHGHIAIAAAPTAEQVTPIEGDYSFAGEVLNSSLETQVLVDTQNI